MFKTLFLYCKDNTFIPIMQDNLLYDWRENRKELRRFGYEF